MNIHKNFLPKDIFDKLKNTITSDYFPWYFNNGVSTDNDDFFQFTFSFIKDGKEQCWGEWWDLIVPVIEKIKHKKMNRVKANLLTKTNKIIQHDYHTDQERGTTGILYLNNCNGYTIFKNGKKIISEENKYIEFDSTLKHAGTSCTDEKRRIVINFNY
tara:strand:+ start:726 stop:1199 length:474 start_codon:yes stop_codon:yes gene_type:complete